MRAVEQGRHGRQQPAQPQLRGAVAAAAGAGRPPADGRDQPAGAAARQRPALGAHRSRLHHGRHSG
ncbi:hypothetical protein BWP11_21915, partial [Aeromonas hydrophila]